MRLAGLILDELQRSLGVTGTLEGWSDGMVRETRMPAVAIEPFAQTDRPRGPADADQVARAIAAGLRRFFREG
jgi:N-acetylmuramoyl-L-alanine amidase